MMPMVAKVINLRDKSAKEFYDYLILYQSCLVKLIHKRIRNKLEAERIAERNTGFSLQTIYGYFDLEMMTADEAARHTYSVLFSKR